MSRYTNQKYSMNIEHITYDQARSSRPQRRHSERSPRDEERHVTMWPKTEASPLESRPGMTTYPMLERHLEKVARTERSTPESRDREAHRPRRKPVANQASRPQPLLQRKLNFSGSLRECLRSSNSAEKKHTEAEGQRTKIFSLRDAIQAGKLEVAVPPSRSLFNDRPAPPRAQAPEAKSDQMTKIYTLREAIRAGRLEVAVPPTRSLVNDRPAPPRAQVPVAKHTSLRTSRHNKRSSAPTKLGELIDRSAVVLDETRKEISSKFRPPFENLKYPSFVRAARKSSWISDASGLSFYCIGEQENEPTEEFESLKVRQQQNNQAQRMSDEGTDPWVHPPPAVCRLCKKPGIRGVRGLCNQCENDFVRPKPRNYDFIDSDEEDIKPTPPLKDRNILTAKRTSELCRSVSHSSRVERRRQQPQDPVKIGSKMTNTDSYPQIVNQAPRQYSRNAMVEGEDGERFRSWQMPAPARWL